MTYRNKLAKISDGSQAVQMVGGYVLLVWGSYLEWGVSVTMVVAGLWCCVDVWLDRFLEEDRGGF